MNTEHLAQSFVKSHFSNAPEQTTRSVATVLKPTEDGFLVKLDSGECLIAQQAFTCGYTPIQQDLVELLNDKDHGYFVLSILVRKQTCPAQVTHPHGLEVHTPSIKMRTNETEFESQRLTMNVQSYQQNSSKMNINTDEAHYLARSTHVATDTLMQKIKDSFKFIERIEHVKAKDIIQTIKNAFIQRSKQVDISAESDVKINGDRIHMG